MPRRTPRAMRDAPPLRAWRAMDAANRLDRVVPQTSENHQPSSTVNRVNKHNVVLTKCPTKHPLIPNTRVFPYAYQSDTDLTDCRFRPRQLDEADCVKIK